MKQIYDVIIVGAGPAGLSTALHLAKIDPGIAANTLVLERGQHPRNKLCAGGLTVDAENLLENLKLNVNEVPHVIVNNAHLQFEGRGLNLQLPKRPALRVIRRDEFDAWLAEKTRQSGIEILENMRVNTIRPEEDLVRLETEKGDFQARVVVGADGSNGIVRKCILPSSPLHTARLLEVISPPLSDPNHQPDHAYFDFFCVPNGIAGYTWDFPTQIKGEPMRCWGIFDNNLLADQQRAALKTEFEEEMQRHNYNLVDYELKGHPIRLFSPSAHFSAPRVLLAGDAAGSDPLFGEGISIALGYGKLASQVIQAAFKSDDFSFKSYRKKILFSPLGQTLILRSMIANLIYSFHWRWFQRLLWQFFHPFVKLAGWMLIINWGKRLK